MTDVDIRHHFGGGVYIKETRIPPGFVLVQHKHKFDHLSILASGAAVVNGTVHTGPTVLVIKAGEAHGVRALSDCLWYCVHATTVTDPADVDEVLIVPSSEAEIREVVERT